jgi:uncharacterized protein (TIGR02391 family)
MRKKAQNALDALRSNDEKAAQLVSTYLKTDLANLQNLWGQKFPIGELGYLNRHISFGMEKDYHDILLQDIPKIEENAEKHFRDSLKEETPVGFENLLHPVVLEHAYQQYRNGHLRDAVLNAIVAVFDFIRQRTGLTTDGDRLIGEVLSSQNPRLILSELETESGKNDQTGFLQIFQGAYKGIRNPKAHSLQHNLNKHKAAQYLVFASLLARRIEEAKAPKSPFQSERQQVNPDS